MYIVKVKIPWYKCDFAPKITGITSHVVIIADTEDTKKSFVDIRDNIKFYFTVITDERGWGILIIIWIK